MRFVPVRLIRLYLLPVAFFLLTLTSYRAAHAQSAAVLTGEWREVARYGTTRFQDTVFLSLKIGQEFMRVRQNGFAYRGVYKVSNGRIDLSGIQYSIRMRGTDTMLLASEGTESTYIRWTPSEPVAYNHSDGSTNRATEALPGGVAHVTSPAQLAGNWSVFKRTSTAVQSSIDYRRLIKSIVIFTEPRDGDSSLGYILAGSDAPATPGWRITALTDGVLTATGRDGRTLRILAFANGELVVEEAPYTYFFKQFNY